MTEIKNTPFTQWTGLAGRVALGFIFAWAGFLKAVAPAEEFAYAIETYKVFPAWMVTLSALTVPWAEIYLGLLLAAGLFTLPAAALTGAMIVFFQVLLAQAMVRGLPITSCGCFGTGKGNPIGVELALNFILLALAVLAWLYGRDRFSLDGAIESLPSPAPRKEKP
ncbi:MAG: DoxX family protein [Elusimicrobia bacterium]|nr:MAG: DoxX family protein [Elusimicrobiota bacterium]KAF0156718.1 MAG: DoxX family protein [Elusimicrobiota bacterium]